MVSRDTSNREFKNRRGANKLEKNNTTDEFGGKEQAFGETSSVKAIRTSFAIYFYEKIVTDSF